MERNVVTTTTTTTGDNALHIRALSHTLLGEDCQIKHKGRSNRYLVTLKHEVI